MRVITGKAKGKKLIPPDGYDVTRPTLDRVKQAIFNIIQNHLNYESVVLDLFSGTGSLGLEACSRGAKLTYLCERNDTVFSYLNKNIENLNFKDLTVTMKGEFDVNLRRFKDREKFDLIFIDSPYNSDYVGRSINLIDELNLLKIEGLIVTKISTQESKFIESENINLTDYRKYGNTTVCFYRYKENYR